MFLKNVKHRLGKNLFFPELKEKLVVEQVLLALFFQKSKHLEGFLLTKGSEGKIKWVGREKEKKDVHVWEGKEISR